MEMEPKCMKNRNKMTLRELCNELDKEYRKRYSRPIPLLTQLELDTLTAIADGRTRVELDPIIKVYAAKQNYTDSYYSLVKRLIIKFEAFSLANVIYKAMQVGTIE